MPGVDRNPNAGHGDLKVRKFQNLARFVAEFLFFIGFAATIVDQFSGKRNDVVSDRSRKLFGSREIDCGSRHRECRRTFTDLADLIVEFRRTCEASAGDGLECRDGKRAQASFNIKRLQHRHRDHGRAIRIGNDVLRDGVERVSVHFRHDERNVGIHAPGRGVIDDDGTRFSNPRCECQRRTTTCREHDDVEAGVVGCLGIFDLDFGIGPRQTTASRTSRRE
ncbi:unannotated protein [freshwater metagenome]|uniref:Unannotated protein n=1 Tax=freshwater metagenome TaxID=449393 RepID=A0A6J6H0G2_9ZZZZ